MARTSNPSMSTVPGTRCSPGSASAWEAGLPVEVAVKLGVAAGALNVARHGLGTGHLREVASLCEQVRIDPLQAGGADPAARSAASTAS